VKDPDGVKPPVYLDWDRAVNDAGQLRRCPVCGSKHLFVRPDVPRLTVFVALLIITAMGMIAIGAREVWMVLLVLLVVAAADTMVRFLSGTSIVCRRCHSEYRGSPLPSAPVDWEANAIESGSADGEAHHGRADEAGDKNNKG